MRKLEHRKELKIIQKESSQKEALGEAILASIGDGLVVVDKKGKINYVNQAFEKLVGWESHEVLGKYIIDVLPREDEKGEVVPFNERILTKVLAGEVVIADLTNPYYYIRKDKTRFPTSSIVTPITLHGKIVGVVETFRNITKEKEVDKAKTEFVSFASHQLRTPLSSVNWYTEMLLAEDVGPLNSVQKRYLDEVYRASQRMVGLVKALLDVSRMDLGTFIMETEPTDIVLLVQGVINEQRLEINKKDIDLSYKFDGDIPLMEADQKHLNMVVQNILSNAVKYTPVNGNIKIVLWQEKAENKVILKITDTGYGIPKEEQEKIFGKLFRAKNVQEKDTEGTGLGLYIVKAIVNHFGGDVWFESEENVGTSFFVQLSLNQVS